MKETSKEAIALSRGEVGGRGTFRCRPSETFPADPVIPLTDEGSGLTVYAAGLLVGDEIAVAINGRPIPPVHLSWKRPAEGRVPWCTAVLSSPPFVYGDNYLSLTLTKCAEQAAGDITVERVQCMVRAGQV